MDSDTARVSPILAKRPVQGSPGASLAVQRLLDFTQQGPHDDRISPTDGSLASILLLPGALLAGVAGMNVTINAHTFAHSPLFWLVVTTIILIALTTLSIARLRRWI